MFIGGNTLQSLAAGKTPYQPEETQFDKLRADMESEFDRQQDVRSSAELASSIEQAVNRGLMKNLEEEPERPGMALPKVARAPGCNSDDQWPPCRLITGVDATLGPDALTGALFYDLMPAHNFPGMTAGGRVSVSAETFARHQYDVASFPGSIGPSFSMSAWVRPEIALSSTYLIAKHPSSDDASRCWSFNIASSRVGMYAGATVQGAATQTGEPASEGVRGCGNSGGRTEGRTSIWWGLRDTRVRGGGTSLGGREIGV